MIDLIYNEQHSARIIDGPLLTALEEQARQLEMVPHDNNNTYNNIASSNFILDILEQALVISRQLDVVIEQILTQDESERGIDANGELEYNQEEPGDDARSHNSVPDSTE